MRVVLAVSLLLAPGFVSQPRPPATLAYIAHPFDDANAEVHVVGPEGDRALTHTTPDAAGASWSPARAELAVVSTGRAADVVWRYDAASDRYTRLVAIPVDRSRDRNEGEIALAWSPDGQSFGFSDSQQRLWLIRRDGRGRTRVVPPLRRGEWLGDGWDVGRRGSIVLAATAPRSRGAIYVRVGRSWRRIGIYGRGRNASFGYPVPSPDGKRIAVWSRTTTGNETIVVDVASGAERFLPGGDALWAPGSTQIALSDDFGVDRVFDVLDGSRQGHRWIERDDQAWTRDGRFVVGMDAGRPFLVDVASGATRRLTRRLARPLAQTDGVFAPSGTKYLATSRDGSSLVIAALGGARAKTISARDDEVEDLQWSADGRLLAYEANDHAVIRRSTDGRVLTRVPANHVLLAPDGLHAATWTEAGVAVLDLRTHVHRVVAAVGSAVWSPDSTRLAIADIDALLVATADGSERRVLLPPVAVDEACSDNGYADVDRVLWSPDGAHIAVSVFSNCDADTRWYVLDARSGAHLLEWDFDARPLWAPDGRTLSIVGPHSGHRDAVDLSGAVVGPGWTDLPPRSPDGQWSAFSNHGRIWVRRVDRSEGHPVTSGPNDVSPLWQPR